MEEPQYEEILKAKIDYYGETKAAYQLAAEEFARQEVKNSLSVSLPLAVEFGYKQCEKGNNLQMALIEFRKLNSNT